MKRRRKFGGTRKNRSETRPQLSEASLGGRLFGAKKCAVTRAIRAKTRSLGGPGAPGDGHRRIHSRSAALAAAPPLLARGILRAGTAPGAAAAEKRRRPPPAAPGVGAQLGSDGGGGGGGQTAGRW